LGFTQDKMNRYSRAISEKLLRCSHEYGCLDESRTELQRILANLEPSWGMQYQAYTLGSWSSTKQNLNHSRSPMQRHSMLVNSPGRRRFWTHYKKCRGVWDHPEGIMVGAIKNNLLQLQKLVEIH
jgi:hypothetical protein